MEIELKKWGNRIGLPIPHQIAESYGLDENTIIELTESQDTLIIKKKKNIPTLDELLTSIPADFQYPEDVQDFVASEPIGEEII